jgi:DNA-directed RNA polymerase specialized sigma24 family protein
MKNSDALSPEYFQGFLNLLSENPETAAREYSVLREKFVRFFILRGLSSGEAESASDETLDRMIAKMREGEEIEDPTRYGYGIARFILLEKLRKQKRLGAALEELRFSSESSDRDVSNNLLDILKECLASLTEDDRTLLLEYFAVEDAGELNKQRRAELAKKYDLSSTYLRQKIFRLKNQILVSVESKLRE